MATKVGGYSVLRMGHSKSQGSGKKELNLTEGGLRVDRVELVGNGKAGNNRLCMSFNTEEGNIMEVCFLNLRPLRLERQLSDANRRTRV